MSYPKANFEAWLSDLDGNVVSGSYRRGHNIFTRNGKNWLASLVRWTLPISGISGGVPPLVGNDAAVDQRRFSWIAVGTGLQAEDDDVQRLVTPVIYTGLNFLKPLALPTFPVISSLKYTSVYGAGDFGGGAVSISEAAIYVDTPTPALAATVGTHVPVAYKSIDPALGKNGGNTLTIRWEFRF
jgi:hypothetical protein